MLTDGNMVKMVFYLIWSVSTLILPLAFNFNVVILFISKIMERYDEYI